ncbi:MAG: hypothetical protein ACD_3C00086G0048 [uncultured bacterium (gcode 4)]|uniref:Uncharacterized protein n=1 Tax=uncultured bacterium (gcode 4) TaxID=1234023 RepID=K2GDB0_9BACT|nr:MAG: hypothetical protein ACD_3C00086G0048 [uncultured bacterium (gcode 4)]
MLTKNQIEHIKKLLKEDWIQEDQMDIVFGQLISFISVCYDSYIKKW